MRNYTGNWDNLLSSYCLLKNYLEKHEKKPKYVIVAFAARAYNIADSDPSYLHEAAIKNFKVYMREFGILKALRFSMPLFKHELFFRQIISDPRVILKLKIRKGEFIRSYIQSYRLSKGYSHWHADIIYGGATAGADDKENLDFLPSENRLYSSQHHLNKNGAFLLSNFLAEEINKLKT